MTEGVKLTVKQRAVLAFVAAKTGLQPWEFATAGQIGEAIHTPRESGIQLKAQGYGRLGGTMAWRLMDRGLLRGCSHGKSWGYKIAPAGRQALATGEGR